MAKTRKHKGVVPLVTDPSAESAKEYHRKRKERKKKAAKTRIANKEKKLLEEEAKKFGLTVNEFKKLYPKKAKQIKHRARAKSKSSVWTVRG